MAPAGYSPDMNRFPFFVFFLMAVIVTLAAPVGARAHASLDRASPAVGSTVVAAPTEVVLRFTESLEPAFSSIEVRNAAGAAMQAGRSSIDPKQRTQMRVPLKALPPGTDKVIWRVLTVDTHRMQGDFSFRVGP
jgi:methionine-rich copper-binding protein CopC